MGEWVVGVAWCTRTRSQSLLGAPVSVMRSSSQYMIVRIRQRLVISEMSRFSIYTCKDQGEKGTHVYGCFSKIMCLSLSVYSF